MIRVTDLDQRTLMLNADMIQHIQETPDTVIVLINGESYRVLEDSEEVRRRVIDYRREIGTAPAGAAVSRNLAIGGQNG